MRRDAERSSASGIASGTVVEGPGGRARLAAAVAVSTHEKTVGSPGGKRETNNETQAVYHTPQPRPQPHRAWIPVSTGMTVTVTSVVPAPKLPSFPRRREPIPNTQPPPNIRRSHTGGNPSPTRSHAQTSAIPAKAGIHPQHAATPKHPPFPRRRESIPNTQPPPNIRRSRPQTSVVPAKAGTHPQHAATPKHPSLPHRREPIPNTQPPIQSVHPE